MIVMVKVRNSLVGQKFGRLTVIKQCDDYINSKGVHYAKYSCLCECGENIDVTACHLKDGHTQSCGCSQKERVVQACTKRNTYDLSGEYGIGWTNNTNNKFYFDLEDYEKICDRTWYEDKDGYICSDTRGRIKMHRLILNVLDKECDVDHINGRFSKHDNRKSNLRVCSRAENLHNRIYMSTNTSGCIGVVWDKNAHKWLSRLDVNKKTIYLGCFDRKEDAINARICAEKKYYGEFAPNREETEYGYE